MSQCVPSWEVDDPPAATSLPLHDQPTSAAAPLVPLDYEVAELTWENGQLALHGFGGSPRMGKPVVKSAPTGPAAAANANWSKHQLPGAGGTLESVVNQATGVKLFPGTAAAAAGAGRALGLGGWIGGPHHGGGDGGVPAVLLDALVPCRDDADAGAGRRVPDAATAADGESGRKRTRAIAGVQCSSQGSAAAPVVGRGRRMESTLVTIDTCGTTDDFGITNTATATTMATNSVSLDEGGDGSPDTDSVSHSRRSQPKRDACEEDAKASKKSRAAAIHNQSERKRRDRINQKMKTLQKLVPNSSKTDKASILDEVIEYLKQLQAQVQMMSRMNSMMMPMAMPPQIQMSIMANMAHMAQMAQMAQMGMMDAGAVSRAPSAYPPLPPLLHPSAAAFLPTAGGTWDGVYGADQMAQQPAAGGSVLPDPLSALIACQNAQQPMTMDAYSRMATMFQQFYHQQQQQQQPTPPPPPTAPTSNPKT